MAVLVPSQVVAYIDLVLPGAKAQAESPKPGHMAYPRAQAGELRCLLEMLGALPDHLLTLQGDALAEYMQAVAAVRMAVTSWEAGDTALQLSKLTGRGPLNPVTFIRKHLLSLADEGVPAGVHELAFVGDEAMREALRRDLHAVNSALSNGQWKAATVLGGSLLEALLLDALVRREGAQPGEVELAAQRAVAATRLPKMPPKSLLEWSLDPMIEVSAELGLTPADAAAAARIARGFRNLIHPGREVRLQMACHRGTALSVVAAVEHVIRCLEA